MQTNYNGHSGKSGIYQIRNLNNGRVYIGSAKLFSSRYQQHLYSLKKGTHHNKHLQGAFNLEGTDTFIFEVLEVVHGEQSDRLLVEQRHLDAYLENWELCYNFKKQAEAESRSCFSKNPEQTRKLMSEGIKRHYDNPENRLRQSRNAIGIKKKPFTKEHCENLGKSNLGRIHSNQTRQKMSESHKTPEALQRLKNTYEKHKDYIQERNVAATSKTYYLIDPNGQPITVKNLNKFCRDNGLHWYHFSRLFRGLIDSYNGWTRQDVQ